MRLSKADSLARKRRIARMYRAGKPIAEMAATLGVQPGSMAKMLSTMRAEGWELPHRRPRQAGEAVNPQGTVNLFRGVGEEVGGVRSGEHPDVVQVLTLVDGVEEAWSGDSSAAAAGARVALRDVREQIRLRFGTDERAGAPVPGYVSLLDRARGL